MIMLTVDGRQVDSRGVTQTEMGRMMAELGAHHALNLDGGGSSTLLAREPGAPAVQVENGPSDGIERAVPNGLAIYAPKGSGRLTGYWVETASDPTAAPGISPVRGGRPDRVFPGLTRVLTAAGYDETYGPAAGAPTWRATPAVHGRVDRDGVFHAGASGASTVTAARGRASGSLGLTVLGPLARIGTTVSRVGLTGRDGQALVGVVGYDADGNTAPIEPADLTVDYDRDLLRITPTADGNLSVSALRDTGSGLVTVQVGRSSTVLPVTVGLTDVPVAGFDDAGSWRFSQARASGSVEPAPGHTGTGLRMSYDFSQSTGTRAAYADPPAWIEVPGQPQAFGMWIHGNGTGEWPSLHLHDAQDTQHVLRGTTDHLDRLAVRGVRGAGRGAVPGAGAPVLRGRDERRGAVLQRGDHRRPGGEGAPACRRARCGRRVPIGWWCATALSTAHPGGSRCSPTPSSSPPTRTVTWSPRPGGRCAR